MKLFSLFSALLCAAFAENAWSSAGPTELQREEASPTGKLRVGVVSAPARSAFFVVQDASGEPRGVTVDLGKELARALAAQLPGSRILDGNFLQTGIAINETKTCKITAHPRRWQFPFSLCVC